MFKCEKRTCWNKQTLYVTKEKEFCNCISATLHKLPFRVPKNVRTASQVGSWEAKELLSRVQQAENTSLSPTWKGFLLKTKFSECAVKKNAWAFSSFSRILLIRQLQQDSQMNKPQQMHIMHIEMMTPEGKKEPVPTSLAELRCATAFPWQTHDGHHLGADAGASLLAAPTNGAHCRVRLATVVLLQRVHVPTDAGALSHVLSWGAHLSALHFGCKDTVSQWMDKQRRHRRVKRGRQKRTGFRRKVLGDWRVTAANSHR